MPWRNSPLWTAHSADTNFPWTAQYTIPTSAAIFWLSHVDSFWHVLWFFLCFSWYRQFTGNQYGLTDNVCVLVFKILYPLSDIARAQARITICMLKLRVNIWRRDFLLNKKFYHCILPKQHVLTSYFVALKYDHITHAGDTTFSLVWGNNIWK